MIQMQTIIFKAMSGQIRNKVEKLIKSGISDSEKLFEETMKKPRTDEQFKNLMKQSGIDMDIVEATVRSTIKELLSKPEKKSLISKLFKLKA